MSTEYSPNCCTIYILLSSSWNLLQTDHILGHKASLSKYKKIEIIPCILSKHKALKLENSNKNSRKKHRQLKAKQHSNEIKKEIKDL
jgi:hypothetical protein